MRSSVGFWLSVWFVSALACGRQQLDDPSGIGSANVLTGAAGTAGALGGTGTAGTTYVTGASGATNVTGSAGAMNLSGAGGTIYVTGGAGMTGFGGAAGVAGNDGAADAAACGDPYASSSMPFSPCAVDSDCHSAYLFCGPPQANLEACRDADAAVDDCPPPGFADLPICPVTKMITANLCGVRYQRPCNVASDCGPGFTCTASAASTCSAGSPCGTCQAPPLAACVTKADCPKEWDCYAGCACTPNAQTYCFPPFEVFHCPGCGPIPGP
jgi:hypothetical protein